VHGRRRVNRVVQTRAHVSADSQSANDRASRLAERNGLPSATKRLVQRNEVFRYGCFALRELRLRLKERALCIEHVQKVAQPELSLYSKGDRRGDEAKAKTANHARWRHLVTRVGTVIERENRDLRRTTSSSSLIRR
jgi:hypothetical protein